MISVPLINKYIWSRPDVYQHLNTSEHPVTGWSDAPVYPINEQPESVAPYVIYSWTTKPDSIHWSIENDDITFYLWDYDIYRIMQLESQLRNYLGREDDSAAAINAWVMSNPSEHTSGVANIKSVRYGGSTQAFTQTQESGVVGKAVTFRVQYIDCDTSSPLV